MKTRVVVSLLFAVAFAGTPALAQEIEVAAAPRIEVLFVLDSTGSMSSAIHEAKTRILEIAASIAEGEPRPRVRFGVLTYRDRGDAYITKRWALSEDWEATRKGLASIRADGGGDTPESVVQAMHEGIRDTKWTLDPSVMKVLYLIGDAPPKIYDDDPDLDADLRWAAQNGIAVHSIGCAGLAGRGRAFFERVARMAEGRYHGLRGAEAAADALPGAVVTVEEAERSAARPTASLSDVVARTARTFSGELGVRYEEDELQDVDCEALLADDAGASGLRGRHARIVRDAASWRLLWAAHTSTAAEPAPLPAVDFHEEAVVVVSSDEAGGPIEVLRGPKLLLVRRTTTPAALLARLFERAGPAHVTMLRIPAWDGAVRFQMGGTEG